MHRQIEKQWAYDIDCMHYARTSQRLRNQVGRLLGGHIVEDCLASLLLTLYTERQSHE